MDKQHTDGVPNSGTPLQRLSDIVSSEDDGGGKVEVLAGEVRDVSKICDPEHSAVVEALKAIEGKRNGETITVPRAMLTTFVQHACSCDH